MSRSDARPERPIPEETRKRQGLAADPTVSAWVSANAGTGKTHVLSRRVLRLMLSGRDARGTLVGTPPERILCLTFTKAAAAEMASRVFKDLASWTIANETDLVTKLTDLLGRAPAPDERLLARRLFARAIETPGGLKVQTIHSFSEKLLQRFPLEAGIAPDFTVLDEASSRELLRAAIDGMLRDATTDRTSPLGAALHLTVTHAVEDSFEQVLNSVLGIAARHGVDLGLDLGEAADREIAFADLDRDLRARFKVRADATPEAIAEEMAAVAGANVLPMLIEALRGGTPKDDAKSAEILLLAANESATARRVGHLRSFFLTKDGDPRQKLMGAKVAKARPDLQEMMQRAQETFHALATEHQGLTVVEASLAIVRLAADVRRRYEGEKAHRAALDYGDLIDKSARLLSRSDQAQWVLYKLDGGLDHILVDEAQDTSRQQWDIVEHLAEEFYAGESVREGADANLGPRTVFAVGDDKQSIYGFQGAAPKLFAYMGAQFAGRAAAAARAFHSLPLDLSFRTVAPVLGLVDAVFNGPERPAGVTGDVSAAVRHLVHRADDPGLIELWDPVTSEDIERTDPWGTEDEGASVPPPVQLATRIAETIRGWLDAGEILASTGKPIRESDILILVRKRTPFAAPMISALKAAGIGVAGADRIRIAEQLAVMDLLALIDVLLLPEDDLALATVLRSPICGLSEDELFALAASRPGTLWQALLKAEREGRHVRIMEELKRWRSACDYSPPYEFLAALLDHDPALGARPVAGGSVRARLLARLGPEAADALDELLSLALRYDENEAPSLQGFVTWMRSGGAEIKRDMEQGRPEVRIMTVHGAKGLEAPIVFLADTCSARSGGFGARLYALDADKADAEARIVWPIKGTSGLAPVQDAKAIEQAEERHEYHRLLYVAMTRARDRLYVCGYEGKKGRDPGCWYDLIERGAAAMDLTTIEDAQGRRIRRFVYEGRGTIAKQADPKSAGGPPMALPAWATTRAPALSARAIPLRPSRLAPVAMEDDAMADVLASAASAPQPTSSPQQPVLRPSILATGHRFLRGDLTHALLEHLPAVAPQDRRSVAERFLDKRGSELPAAVRRGIVAETMTILEAPLFASLFGPNARAEVGIAAEIADPRGRGAPLRVTGQIDRLVDLGSEILVVDYKTNRPPPLEVAQVAEAYLLQLAAYRLVLRGVWPGKDVRCALLWTDGPRIMEIPKPVLDASERALWSLGPSAGPSGRTMPSDASG